MGSDSLGYFAIGTSFLMLLILVGLGFWQSQVKAKMKHVERMKVLETGRDFPDEPDLANFKAVMGQKPPSTVVEKSATEGPQAFASKCFSAAVWIGFWGFLFAGQSGIGVIDHAGHSGTAIAIGASTGAGIVTALICGTILATRPVVQPSSTVAKPYYAREEV